ncbi:11811_t:CDS:1 [Acaulospora colombiana]|uniref:11811_t:CDS:1 n=1 Tax=Acaulospora colombiana TaxID=27376 RepID=A0ACA9LXF4_9GLOM|nr:11811_t:CDS:1 [Acaulospora colombiana]
MNVTHIEFKPLDSKRHNSEERQGLEEAKLQVLDSSQIHRLVDGSVIDNSSVKSTQPSKRTKTKRSRSVRILDPLIISEDSTEKIDTDELARLKCAVKEGEENLSYSGYSIDKS